MGIILIRKHIVLLWLFMIIIIRCFFFSSGKQNLLGMNRPETETWMNVLKYDWNSAVIFD